MRNARPPRHSEAMPTPEDNYRVEVWSDDGKTLVETLSRSPDFNVSLVAWHEAVRRRPGHLLIHANADRVMERLVAPGEKQQRREDFSPALRDLRHWHQMRLFCSACRKSVQLDTDQMIERFGRDAILAEIEKRFTCGCPKRRVKIEVSSKSRD